MKKSIYALFFCFFCGFCLFGCGENVTDMQVVNQPNAFRIVRQANENGSVALAYVFPINSEKLQEKGLTENDVRSFRYYLSAYVGTLAKQNKQRAGDGVSVSDTMFFQDVDGLGFSISFDSVQAQKKFFNVDESVEEVQDSTLSNKTSGFFVKKSEISTIFPVSTVQSAENLKQVCKLALTTWASISEHSDLQSLLQIYDQSKFIYHFSSTQTALKSEICFDKNGFRQNVFVKTQEQIAAGDDKITFYVTQPNTPVWYASAVIVVLVGMATAYLLLKNRKNKKGQAD